MSDTSEPSREIPIGPHVATLLAPDVIRIAWNGDVLAEHILAVGELIASRPHEGRGVFLLQDNRRIGKMTAAARKAITRDANSRVVRGVVIFGASFHLRVIMEMIQKAMHTFRRHNATMTFCDSEEEAMAFIDETRRKKPQGNTG